MMDVTTANENINQFKDEEEARPPSEQLVELHIYLVPKEKWLEKRKLAKNQAVDHTISVGFVRVIPQTLLSELRKEMNRQLGVESVPQSFVFLRSVGRNFTQVRQRQEMEMKVKNYMPPYATDPEIYLKEGPYTGSNTWSQGEDSGLEESVGDSNSQRSHDRATPESLADEQLVLSKVSDLIESLQSPDIDDNRPSSTPTKMAITMEEDEILTAKNHQACQKFVTGVPDIQMDSRKPDNKHADDVYGRNRRRRDKDDMFFDYSDLPEGLKDGVSEIGAKPRAGSLNRRPSRVPSKERGGTQLPTWTETRTTRLRRSKALGETKQTNNHHQPRRTTRATKGGTVTRNTKAKESPEVKNRKAAPKADALGTEQDEDSGKILMERIRANSRCLRARLSSHTRRHVTGTGARSKNTDLDKLDVKYNGDYNGVYTMHARKNLKPSIGTADDDSAKEQGAEIESTSINLLDEEGKSFEMNESVDIKTENLESYLDSNPEILHLHTLSIQGEDGRADDNDSTEILNEGRYEESAERENFEGNDGPVQPADAATAEKVAQEERREDNTEFQENAEEEEQNEDTTDYQEDDDNEQNVKDLQEGHVVNHQGNLTIEVEVKELQNEEDANLDIADDDDQQMTAKDRSSVMDIDDSMQYDSYPVYSEQNLPYTSSVEFPVPVPAPVPETKSPKKSAKIAEANRSRNLLRKQDRPQYSRGIYLRKREYRDRSVSNVKRSQSDGSGLFASDRSPADEHAPLQRIGDSRSTSLTRRGGMGSIEKWNTTSSTGDLTELPWNNVSEKERLLTILDSIRAETRAREKHREELLRRIKQLQNRVHHRREQVRDMWRKRYLEAKKVTPRLEEECSRLRQELEKLHRELLAKVQAGVWALLTISGKTEKPSNKLSYKIMIARLLQEIEDLSRRVEGTRLKLHTELKLRSMAEKDVRNLREELLKKKIQVTLTRNQEQAAMGNDIRQQYFISAV